MQVNKKKINNFSSIRISEDSKNRLKALALTPHESYENIILRLTHVNLGNRKIKYKIEFYIIMRFSKNQKHESEQSLFNKFHNKFFIKKEKEISPDNKKATKLVIKIIINPIILWIFKKRILMNNPYKLIYGHYFYDGIIQYKDILFTNNKFIDKQLKIRQTTEDTLYKNESNQTISDFNYDVMFKLLNELNDKYKENQDTNNVDIDYEYNEKESLVIINEPIETIFDNNKKILEIL